MDKIESRRTRWRVLLIVAGAWFFVDGILLSPDFGHLDIYYFKDAGINFAQGLGLTTRFSYGSPSFVYHDYAQYPPLYPLTFGLYAEAAGISALSNQAFNSLVAILAGVAGFVALRPMIARAAPTPSGAWLEPVLAMLSVTTGYFYLSGDRPDGLAVVLGIAALLLALRGVKGGSAAAGGALCTLALFTSPFAGVLTSVATAIGILTAVERAPNLSLRRLAWVALGGCIAAVSLLCLLRVTLPGWFDGFLGVATGSETHNETGGGYFLALLHGNVRTWWSGFAYSRPESLVLLIKLAAVAAGLSWMIIREIVRTGGIKRAVPLLALLLACPICLITAPYQSNYATITAALLLAAWASIEANRPAESNRGAAAAILLTFAANVALTAPFEARALLVRFEARESLSRALAYLEAHRVEIEARPGYLAVSPTNYILWRQAGLHPLINVYSGFRTPANRDKLETLALSYPGSGNPLSPQTAEYIPMGEYAPAFRPVLPQYAMLFGRALSNSSQTWESAIYTRLPPSTSRQYVGVDQKIQPGDPNDEQNRE